MPQPWVFSYTFLDTNNVKASVSVYYQPDATTITLAQIEADWLALGDLFNDATNAALIGGKFSQLQKPDVAWRATPIQENDVSDVITLNYNNADNKYAESVLLVNNTNAEVVDGKPDLTETNLAALAAGLALATTVALHGDYATKVGQPLTTLRDAFLADRKHRRQLRNKSIQAS